MPEPSKEDLKRPAHGATDSAGSQAETAEQQVANIDMREMFGLGPTIGNLEKEADNRKSAAIKAEILGEKLSPQDEIVKDMTTEDLRKMQEISPTPEVPLPLQEEAQQVQEPEAVEAGLDPRDEIIQKLSEQMTEMNEKFETVQDALAQNQALAAQQAAPPVDPFELAKSLLPDVPEETLNDPTVRPIIEMMAQMTLNGAKEMHAIQSAQLNSMSEKVESLESNVAAGKSPKVPAEIEAALLKEDPALEKLKRTPAQYQSVLRKLAVAGGLVTPTAGQSPRPNPATHVSGGGKTSQATIPQSASNMRDALAQYMVDNKGDQDAFDKVRPLIEKGIRGEEDLGIDLGGPGSRGVHS